MIEIIHKCDSCKWSIEGQDCMCEDCVAEENQKAYNEGYADARKEFEVVEEQEEK